MSQEKPGAIKSDRAGLIRKMVIAAVFLIVVARENLLVNGQGIVNQPTFTGSVVDAATHQPVGSFTARIGIAFNKTAQVMYQEPPQQFTGGQYRLTAHTSGRFSWYVRIEAHGYLPELSPAMTGAGTQDFEMTPAKDLQGTVFTPDGKPAAGVKVAAALPGVFTIIYMSTDMPVVTRSYTENTTDAQGKYDLAPESGHFAVVAYGDQGYAQVDQDALARSSDIHLAAWGRIEGKILFGTKPAPGQQLSVSKPQPATGEPWINFPLVAMSGTDGTFTVDRFPQGMTQIARQVTQTSGQLMTRTTDQPTTFFVTAGETAKVTVGGVGRPVEGEIVFPPGMSADSYLPNAIAMGGRTAYPPQMPDGLKSANLQTQLTWMRSFALSPDGKQYLKTHEAISQKRYVMEMEPDQKFRLLNVTPGDYQMTIYVRPTHGGAQPPAQRVTFTMPDVPDGVSDEPLVIPDITIKPN